MAISGKAYFKVYLGLLLTSSAVIDAHAERFQVGFTIADTVRLTINSALPSSTYRKCSSFNSQVKALEGRCLGELIQSIHFSDVATSLYIDGQLLGFGSKDVLNTERYLYEMPEEILLVVQ